MDKKLRIVLSLSSYPEMLRRADALIELAGANPQHEDVLSASTVLVFAVAMEQAIFTKCTAEATSEMRDRPERFGALLAATLRRRVFELPQLLTDGKFEIDRRRPESQALHSLITARNELMHISEEPEIREVGISDAQLDAMIKGEPSASAMVSEHIQSMLPTNLGRWFQTKLSDVRLYRSAVHAYADEVLAPDPDSIRHGNLIIPRRG